jgi:S-adenosylmethionine synthetase
LREDDDGFALEHVLVTLEHPEAMSVFELAQRVSAVFGQHYGELRALDRRWNATWPEVELMVNPNGPLSDAGSRKDNGQTGRKLVMDYYGPRVPIGGGAIYGKDPMHVDRFGARKAREMALEAVKKGAGECLVRAMYAPNVAEPLDVQVEVSGLYKVRRLDSDRPGFGCQHFASKLTSHNLAIADRLPALRQLTGPPTIKQRPITSTADLRGGE